jgi:hypothetical protein
LEKYFAEYPPQVGHTQFFCPAFFCPVAEIMINDGIETVIRELMAPSLARFEGGLFYHNGDLWQGSSSDRFPSLSLHRDDYPEPSIS